MRKTVFAAIVLALSGGMAAWADVSKHDIEVLLRSGTSETDILRYVNTHRPVLPLSADDLGNLRAEGATEILLQYLTAPGADGAPYDQGYNYVEPPAYAPYSYYPYVYPRYGWGPTIVVPFGHYYSCPSYPTYRHVYYPRYSPRYYNSAPPYRSVQPYRNPGRPQQQVPRGGGHSIRGGHR